MPKRPLLPISDQDGPIPRNTQGLGPSAQHRDTGRLFAVPSKKALNQPMERHSAAIDRWLARDPDPHTRQEIEFLRKKGDFSALDDRFYRRLSFGTAGIRGPLGAGPNRINRLMVIETTLGVATYLAHHTPHDKRIVVAFDGRHGSEVFAADVAACFAHFGMEVYQGEQPLPTPLLAFAIEHLEAAGGVMITASHNPKEDNGYKLFGAHSGQILPEEGDGIARRIASVAAEPLPKLAYPPQTTPFPSDLLSAYDSYVKAVAARMGMPDARSKASLSIAYSPMHGVAGASFLQSAHALDFSSITVVEAQAQPDPEFPTVPFPNPEEEGALDLLTSTAQSAGAELALAHDPDGDRVALMIPEGDSYRRLSGDEVGCLLAYALLKKGDRGALVSTIVSSRLLQKIATHFDVPYRDTLTGFKWIGAAARDFAEQGVPFLFGYEEAIGYGIGDRLKDKDGIATAAALLTLAATLKEEGKGISDLLLEIDGCFGVHRSCQQSIALNPDSDGLLERLRASAPRSFGNFPIDGKWDLLQGEDQEALALPESDLLIYRFGERGRMAIRPSGTEAKIKCYYEVCHPPNAGTAHRDARRSLEELALAFGAFLQSV